MTTIVCIVDCFMLDSLGMALDHFPTTHQETASSSSRSAHSGIIDAYQSVYVCVCVCVLCVSMCVCVCVCVCVQTCPTH